MLSRLAAGRRLAEEAQKPPMEGHSLAIPVRWTEEPCNQAANILEWMRCTYDSCDALGGKNMDFSMNASWTGRIAGLDSLRKWLGERWLPVRVSPFPMERLQRASETRSFRLLVCPADGIAEDDVVRVIACAADHLQPVFAAPIGQAVLAKSLSVPRADDVRRLEGGIHCWIDGIPTLIGSRDFVGRLGIDVSRAGCSAAAEQKKLFVACGRHLLGWIEIAD